MRTKPEPQAVFQMWSSDAVVYCESRSDSICPSPGTNLWLCNWQKPPIHTHTVTEPPPCFIEGCISFTNFLPLIDSLIWPKDFELWFVSSKDFYPLLNCPVFVRLDSQEPFDIALLPQHGFLESNSSIEARFIGYSTNSGCLHIFSRRWFSCATMFGAVSLLSRKLMKLSSALVASGQPTLLLALFCPVS